MWDYNIGLVRTTHLFRCNEYSKVCRPALMNINRTDDGTDHARKNVEREPRPSRYLPQYHRRRTRSTGHALPQMAASNN